MKPKSTININELNFKYKEACSTASEYYKILDRAYNVIYPNHVPFDDKRSFRDKNIRNRTIYDTTAQIAINDAANQIQEGLMQNKDKWFQLEYKNEYELSLDDEDYYEKVKELQQIEKTTIAHFDRSDTAHKVINSAIKKLLISTCVIYIDEGTIENPYNFIDVSLRDVVFNVDSKNEIKDIFHTLYLTEEELKREYNYNIPNNYNQSKTIQTIKVINAYTKEFTKDGFEYTELNTFLETDMTNVIHTEYFGVSPWIIDRWATNDNERYGIGIIMDMLGDIELCNQAMKVQRECTNDDYAGRFMVREGAIRSKHDPSIITNIRDTQDDFFLHQYKSKKDIIVKYNSNEGHVPSSDVITPIGTSVFPIEELLKLEDKRNNINKRLWFQPLGDVNAKGEALTATETTQRMQMFYTSHSGTMKARSSGLMKPIVERMLYIGAVIDVKDHNKRIDIAKKIKKEIHVTFKAQLKQLDNINDLNNLLQFMQVTQQAIPPEVSIGTLNFEKQMKLLSSYLNIDASIFLTDKEKQQLMDSVSNLQPQVEPQSSEIAPAV